MLAQPNVSDMCHENPPKRTHYLKKLTPGAKQMVVLWWEVTRQSSA